MRLYRPTYTRNGRTHQSKVWWVRFRCMGKDVRKSTGHRHKTAAMAKVAEIVKEEELRAAGIEPPRATKSSVQDLIAEYTGDMERRGVGDNYVVQVRQYLTHVIGASSGLTSITPKVLRANLPCRSANQYNLHLKYTRAFFRWLNEEDRWPQDPTKGIRYREQHRQEKGVLNLEELRKLLAVAGRRRPAYLLAATTGLRRTECDTLLWTDVQVDHLYVPGSRTKNGERAVIPLLPGVVEELGPRVGPKVFKRKVPKNPVMRSDLTKAGLAHEDSRGNPRTFHSLRASLATILAESGVPLTLAQRILRHSDPRLTANVYTKHGLDEQREALGVLGSLLGAKSVTSCHNVSHNSRPNDPQEPAEAGLSATKPVLWQQKFGAPQPLQRQDVAAETQRRLARCLALLKDSPGWGIDPAWDKKAKEALRDR